MYTAALDTSGQYASFSIENTNSKELICENHVIRMGKESSNLASSLSDMLSENGISVSQIKTWIVGLGPGSYTGLRIGIAYLKGICLANGSQLKGYPSSLAMAMAVDSKNSDRIGVLHDGRRQSLVVSTYLNKNNILRPLSFPKIVDVSEIFREEIDQFVILKNDFSLLTAIDQRISVAGIDHIDSTKLLTVETLNRASDGSVIDESLEPVYVRPPVFVKPNKVITGKSDSYSRIDHGVN